MDTMTEGTGRTPLFLFSKKTKGQTIITAHLVLSAPPRVNGRP